MDTTNQHNSQNDQFHEVLEKIREIVRKTEGKYYIYRGESELYPQVCSNLYRAYLSLEVKNPEEAVQKSQKLIVKEARSFLTGNNFYDTFIPINSGFAPISKESPEFEILAQLQHYGCRTNLVDFTTDYLVALHFACAHSDEKPGRVICLEIVKNEDGEFSWIDKNGTKHKVLEMSTIIKRAVFQRSRFIQTNNGIVEIEEGDTVTIPASLKEELGQYLEVYHNISTNNIYGDIHGFIQALNIYPTDYRELQDGKMYEDEGDLPNNAKDQNDLYKKAEGHYKQALSGSSIRFEVYLSLGRISAKLENFGTAIQYYKNAIEQDSSDATIHYALGDVYSQNGNDFLEKDHGKKGERYTTAFQNYKAAIHSYSDAIERDPNNAEYYSSRGKVYQILEDRDNAIEDYKRAIGLDSHKFSPYRELHILYLGKQEWEKSKEVRTDFEKVTGTIKDEEERKEVNEILAELLSMYYYEHCKLCIQDGKQKEAKEYLGELIQENHINLPLLLRDIQTVAELPEDLKEVIVKELESRKIQRISGLT